jgi:hypothetical protein
MKVNKFVKIIAGAVLISGIFVQARAADAKVDPTGTYIWSQPGRNGGPDRTNTLSLKLEGDKLTGKMTAPGRGGAEATSTDISDAKITGSDISFSVTRDFGGNSFTTKYTGKVSADSIKGKVVAPGRGGGDPTERDWEAKKQEAPKK